MTIGAGDGQMARLSTGVAMSLCKEPLPSGINFHGNARVKGSRSRGRNDRNRGRSSSSGSRSERGSTGKGNGCRSLGREKSTTWGRDLSWESWSGLRS